MRMTRFFAALMMGLLLCSISFGATYGGGSGTAEDPYQIRTAEQMNEIGLHPEDWDKQFILMEDIDYSEIAEDRINIISNLFNASMPSDIALDTNNNKMYWVDYGKGEICRALVNGAGVEVLVSGLNSPRGIALDLNHGYLYWTNSNAGKIQRSLLDGSNIEGLVSGLAMPYRITLDLTAGKMYWTDYSAMKLQRANLDGTGIEDIVISGNTQPYAITVDPSHGKIYWTDAGTRAIKRSNLDGSSVEQIRTATRTPTGIVVDESNGKLYWTEKYSVNYSTVRIYRSNLDGSAVESLLSTSFTLPESITLDTTNHKLYWTNLGDVTYAGKIICSDLTLLDYKTIIPARNFSGLFNGNSKIIRNFSYSGPFKDNVGVFGNVGSNALIKDLALSNLTISATGGNVIGGLVGYLASSAKLSNCHIEQLAVVGGNKTGGLVGHNNDGLFENCFVQGSVSGNSQVGMLIGYNQYNRGVSDCHGMGIVEGNEKVGGLVGETSGIYERCSFTGEVHGINKTGGIIGSSNGTVNNSYSSAIVRGQTETGGLTGSSYIINNSYSTGTVMGGQITGGLTGKNSNRIANSYSSAHIQGNTKVGGIAGENNKDILGSYAACVIDANECVGGLVGQNAGTVSSCYSSSEIHANSIAGGLIGNNSSAGLVKYSYSTGFVDAENSAGGLVGSGDTTLVINSFWDTVTSGQVTSSGGMGKTTEELMSNGLFYGFWTCSDVPWTIKDGVDYPHLAWENTGGILLSNYFYSGGTGTQDDPYLISSLDDLIMISKLGCYWDKHFKLTHDIVCSQDPNNQFQIKGPFTGVFDGNGHVIYDYTWQSDTLQNGGLFGSGGLIKNLGLENVSITATSGSNVGAFVGDSGKIVNCYSTGTISIPSGSRIGGLAGNYCSVFNCYSNVNVLGSSYVGGLIGYSYRGIDQCYSTGTVTCTGTKGGFAGYSFYSSITSSFWDTESSGYNIGVGSYYYEYPDVTGKTTSEMKLLSTYSEAGWDFMGDELPNDEWILPDNCYPVLWWQVDPNSLPPLPAFSGGSGQPDDPYLISTLNDLNQIGHNPRLMDKHFKLTNNIDCQSEEFHKIGNIIYPFRGSFDGNGFVISNIIVQADSIAKYLGGSGFFGAIASGSRIIDLGIESIAVQIAGVDSSGSFGSLYAGGLVGYNHAGTIQGCFVVDVDICAAQYAGGLVGYNDSGLIEQCYTIGGQVRGYDYAGGLVGYNSGTIQYCVAAVDMFNENSGGLVGENEGIIAFCFSSSVGPEGGLIGFNREGGSVTSSFFDTERSMQTIAVFSGSSAGITSITTAQAMNMDTFLEAGWDFNEMWSIHEEVSYPFLTAMAPKPEKCRNPSPGNGQMKVGFSPTLSWIKGAGTTNCNIYFGTENSLQFQGNQTGNTFAISGLQSNTAYYWRIDSIGPDGTKTGDVWTFKTFPWYGAGSSEDPYQIHTTAELYEIGYDVSSWDKHFILMNNIDMSVNVGKQYRTIGYLESAIYYSFLNKPFTGVFDGNGYTISNFSHTFTDSSHEEDEQIKGLFEFISGENSEVRNLHIVNPIITNAIIGGALAGYVSGARISNCTVEGGSVKGNYQSKLGGLVGQAVGSIFSSCSTNCQTEGFASEYGGQGGLIGYSASSTINGCFTAGTVIGRSHLGGLVGYSSDVIQNCYSTCNITASSDIAYSQGFVGGLVGYGGDISNSHASCNITSYVSNSGGLSGGGGTIRNSYSTGTIRTYEGGCNIGGLIGYAGQVYRCYSTCNIVINVANQSSIGGIAGGINSSGYIKESFWNGTIQSNGYTVSSVGGLCGTNTGTILNCYTKGQVSGTDFVGGLVGKNSYSGIILQSYSTVRVSSSAVQSGGLAGGENYQVYYSYWDTNTSYKSTSYGGLGKTTAQMKTAATFEGWGPEAAWVLNTGNDYPSLAWEGKPGSPLTDFRYSGGAGTKENPYQINTAIDMTSIAGYPSDWDKYFILTNDINLSGYKAEKYIIGVDSNKPFKGIFDGNNHSITNLLFVRDGQKANYGLFGYVNDPNATITNLNIINPIINVPYDSQTGIVYYFIGAVAGYIQCGNISNCSVSGGTISTDCYAVGGLAGYFIEGSIYGCSSNIKISCSNNGNWDIAGGLVGIAGGNIDSCFALGDIDGDGSALGCTGGLIGLLQDGGSVNNCHASGRVTEGSVVGGLIGSASSNSKVSHCYSDGYVSEYYGTVGGLIGSLYQGAILCDSYASCNVFGSNSEMTGGIVGENAGDIKRCYATGNVSGCRVGGLVGLSSGYILESFSIGNVTESSSYTLYGGGLAGKNDGVILNSYSYSLVDGVNYLGGFVGTNTGTIAYSYAKGYVKNLASTSKKYGGLIAENTGTVICSYWDINTSGLTQSVSGEGRTTSQMKQAQTYLYWGHQDKWTINEGVDYPHLLWQGLTEPNIPGPGQVYEGGQGTADSPYLIASVDQLNRIGLRISDWDKCFCLTNDIDLALLGNKGYRKIGFSEQIAFTGIFDGQGYRILNLTYSNTENNFGLFGYIGVNGKIVNLTTENINFNVTGDKIGVIGGLNRGLIENCLVSGVVTGNNYIGGIAGQNLSEITNCYSLGSVTGVSYVGGIAGSNTQSINACHAKNAVTGTGQIGGLIGRNENLVEKSSAEGIVKGGSHVGGLIGSFSTGKVSTSYAKGAVTGVSNVGGLIGYAGYGNSQDIFCCYARGSVTATSSNAGGLIGTNNKNLYYCYATGLVKGTSNVNGLIGYAYSNTLKSCLWDITTTGCPDNYQGDGLATSVMQRKDTYVNLGWDFAFETANGTNDYWRMCADGVGYPRLSWEYPVGDFVCPDGVGAEDLSVLTSCWLETVQVKADINNDASVDFGDVLKLSQNWLLSGCRACNDADITGDSTVNEMDLTEMAVEWMLTENVGCQMGDLDSSGHVDMGDWAVFAGQWMEGI